MNFSYITDNLIIEFFFLIQHKLDSQRKDIKTLSQRFAQPLDTLQSRSVLLRRDDEFGLRQTFEHLVDSPNVLGLERMVVGEGQRRDEAGGLDRLHWPCGDVERLPVT